MIRILKAAAKRNKVISICIGKVDWDKRLIGYAKLVNEKNIILKEVDIYGRIVKNREIQIDKITVAEIDSSYNKHLEKLKNNSENTRKIKPLYFYNRGSIFLGQVNDLQAKKNICTIFFNTEYITGIVKNHDGNFIYINAIGFRGTKEGQACCQIDRITKIRYQGPLETKISYLLK